MPDHARPTPISSRITPADSTPTIIQRSTGMRAPTDVSTTTCREPSAFIATAVQLPFSIGQRIVCVPLPVAWTRQKLWRGRRLGPGGAGSVGVCDGERIELEVGHRLVVHPGEIALDIAGSGDADEHGLVGADPDLHGAEMISEQPRRLGTDVEGVGRDGVGVGGERGGVRGEEARVVALRELPDPDGSAAKSRIASSSEIPAPVSRKMRRGVSEPAAGVPETTAEPGGRPLDAACDGVGGVMQRESLDEARRALRRAGVCVGGNPTPDPAAGAKPGPGRLHAWW